jgi:hypothetical protein
MFVEESAFFSGSLDLSCCFAPWMVYFLSCKRCLIFRINSTSFLLYSLWPEDVLFGFILVNSVSQNLNTYVNGFPPGMTKNQASVIFAEAGIQKVAVSGYLP